MKLYLDSRIILYFILIVVGISGFFFTVFLPNPDGFYAFIVIVAFAGLGVCLNIRDTKSKGRQLVCPTGSDCNAVVTSRYSKFFGVHLEHWGIAYFSLIAISYMLLIFLPELFTTGMIFVLVMLSVAAGLFSAYLLFVQAVLLKKWCIWCILTAMLSLTIFVVSLVSADIATTLLLQASTILAMIKFFGFSLGVGGSTAAIFLFFHFLEDADIDDKEINVIKGISELIWTGFALVLVSQFAYFITQPEVLVQAGAFLAQIIALFVYAIAGAMLMILYAPMLVFVPFGEVKVEGQRESFKHVRRPAAILGGIVLLSWYFAFLMNFIVGLSFGVLVGVFIVVLFFMGILATLWDRSLHTKKEHTTTTHTTR